MSLKEYHILNGDSLKDRMPEIVGEMIVLRECLIVGDVKGESLEDFYISRMNFFEKEYQISNDGYRNKVVSEFTKILKIEDGGVVYLWFENDLFCQVNFWFAVHVIYKLQKSITLFLVSPIVDSWMGFGAMSQQELKVAFLQKKVISQSDQVLLEKLWKAYQTSSWQQLRILSAKLSLRIDDLMDVVEAHIERFPGDQQLGRPQKSILEIVANSKDPSFGNVFKEFCKTEGIYGFGDLQVEHLMKELNLPIYK